MRDIEEDLKEEYAQYGVDRKPEYYGFVNQEIVDYLLEEQSESIMSDEEFQNSNPTILM